MSSSTVKKIIGFLVFPAFWLALPAIVRDPYYQDLLIVVSVFAIWGVSLRLLLRTGLFSLGHAAFIGIGAYTSALLAVRLGVPFWGSFIAGGLMAAILAGIVGSFFLRTKGIYFAVLTWVFVVFVQIVESMWDALTRGGVGFSVPKPSPIAIPGLITITFNSKVSLFYLASAFFLITMLFFHRIDRARFGRESISLAQAEGLAESIGIPTFRHKLLTFAIGCFFAGIAGAFYVHYYLTIIPDFFSAWKSVDIFVAVIVGGMGSLFGPLVGSFVVVALPELVRITPELRPILYGVIVLLVIFFLPGGLTDIVKLRLPKRGARRHAAAQLSKKAAHSSVENDK